MDEISIKLSRNDFGQLLDGLDVLIEQWDATEDYLVEGRVREDVCIRESHDPHEARAIAETYRNLRERIREQIAVAG